MRARFKYHYWYERLPIIIIALLAMAVAKPTTHTQKITLISNARAEQWELVNKTCQLNSGDCDDTLSMAHLREITQHMRVDVEPCDNFYQYACGNWAQDEQFRHSINMMKYGNEQVVQQYVSLFTQAQLKQGRARQRQSRHFNVELTTDAVFEKLLQYFTVCQRTKQKHYAFELRGYAEALHTLGVWNATDSWLDTLARLGRYGYADHYVKLQVLQKNASEHEVQISPHNKHTKAKLDIDIFNIIKIYTHHTYESLANAFDVLEADIENIMNSSLSDCSSAELDEENECDLLKYYNFEQLQSIAPSIHWQRFIGLHLGRVPQPREVFGVDAVHTIERLVHYVDNMNSELRLIYTVVRFLNYMQMHLRLLKIPEADNINNRCVRHMRKTLYLPMNYIYERYFYAAARPDNDHIIKNIFQQLKTEFALTLNRNEMNFSKDSLQFLHAKLTSLRLNTGNIPLNITRHFYINYINGLNVSGNFYLNHLYALKHYVEQLRQLLQGGRDEHPAWYTFNCHNPSMPDNVDSTAYYYVLSNMIVMPYAYLQRPFFNAHFWPGILYGDLANTLGHEMIHAFDNNFLAYDYAGNMADNYKKICANVEFDRRLQTLKPGTKFLSERIADISGSNLALRTFLKDADFLRHNGKLYFLQFAQFFCGNEKNLARLATDDPDHDVNSLRLNYVLSHVPEFSEVFQCPKGSVMNIDSRNLMW